MDILSLFLQSCPSGTRKRFVAINGNDSTGNGSQLAPFATINRAISDAVAGDQILVSSGTYGYTRFDGRHGTPWQWITLLPATPQDQVKVHINPTNTGTYEELALINSSFIGIYGIEVFGGGLLGVDDANPDRSAVSIYGGSNHIKVWSCHLHDVPGGGINCFDTNGSFDMIDLSFNTIHGTSRRSPSNTSGISVNNGKDITNGKVWRGGHSIRIVGNHIYDVLCTVPFTPGGQTIVTDGNGVSLDLMFDTYNYVKPILVESNIIHGCGARAVHSYGCINTDIFHNVGWGNLRTDSGAINGDPEFDSEQGGRTQTSLQAASNLIYGNIIVPTKNGKWRDNRSTYDYNVVLVGNQAVDGTNIDHKALGLNYALAYASDPNAFVDPSLFVSDTKDLIPRHPKSLGYNACGLSVRPLSTKWAAGPLN